MENRTIFHTETIGIWTAILARIKVWGMGQIKKTWVWKTFIELEQYYGKLHIKYTIKGRKLKGREKAIFVLISNADWQLSCEAINLKPIPATDPRTQLSGGVLYTFVLWDHEAPSKKTTGFGSLYFLSAPIY